MTECQDSERTLKDAFLGKVLGGKNISGMVELQ